jgi:hypothetical protein
MRGCELLDEALHRNRLIVDQKSALRCVYPG